jgi:cell wall-associated NlpC family hydrolase
MAKRIIFGTVLNLVLMLSASLTQAIIPAAPGPSLSPSIWETNELPPLLSRRYNRFEPGSLPDRLCEQAHGYLKTPYRRGGSLQTGKSTDCSGFVQYLYRKADIHLPRSSAEQAQVGRVAARSMDFSRLLPGDLLFFRDGGQHIGHEGIYLGEGKMIHASSHGRGVTVSDLCQPYYRRNFVVAKRLFAAPQPYQASVAPTPTRPAID